MGLARAYAAELKHLGHDVRMRNGHPSYSRSRCNPSESRIAWHREQTPFAIATPFAGSLISAA
jgi:hypothetical protein